MLILTRREGQSILIGDGVRVRVDKIKGKRVKLAIEAPQSDLILRHELLIELEAPQHD